AAAPLRGATLAFVVRGGSGATRDSVGIARTAPSLIAAPFRSARLAQCPEKPEPAAGPGCCRMRAVRPTPTLSCRGMARPARLGASRDHRGALLHEHRTAQHPGPAGDEPALGRLCKASASE